jgi:hypothetical protein
MAIPVGFDSSEIILALAFPLLALRISVSMSAQSVDPAHQRYMIQNGE